MAVMSAFALRPALPPRHTEAASAWRMPPRVYSPLTPRRLARPMAVPLAQGGGARRTSPLSLLLKR